LAMIEKIHFERWEIKLVQHVDIRLLH